MSGIGNNLYPAIVASYMPAFVRNQACKIYFSISNYNSASEIANVQVSIRDQNTNRSVLDENKHPGDVMITSLQEDIESGKYYVSIFPSDLTGNGFELNQFYKVQLRFTNTGAESILDSDGTYDESNIASWLINNQSYFSEWSTVCLVTGILKPALELKGFQTDNENQNLVFTSEVVQFAGKMKYDKEDNNSDNYIDNKSIDIDEYIKKEYMKSYRIQIFNNTSEEQVYDSGEVFTTNQNSEINHTLNVLLEDGIAYRVKVDYKTANEYEDSFTSVFSIIQNAIDVLNATITTEADEEYGRIKVTVKATNSDIFFGNITIRRSSSESNFVIWEDVKTTPIANGQMLDYTWYDYTIKSGVWYKYCVQRRNALGDRGIVVLSRNPIMLIFDDMFLTREDMQVTLRYDPSVSSFKKTLLESKTDPIGSTYPIFRRNGNLGYKQFPISGLITAFCDEEGVFLNKENIYGNNIEYYENYNETNNVDSYYDFIYEREFREKVMEFLYANTIKLFRSTTEGNILVKLMDISFTPNQTLGRRVYSFSATAYEIDECSIDNYIKYGILTVGDYDPNLKYTFDGLGQLQNTYSAFEEVITSIQDKYTNRITDSYIDTLNYLTWLRIEFNMPPYLIQSTSTEVKPQSPLKKSDENTILGYIVYINNKPIVISGRKYYELIDEDTIITSIYFPIASDVTIDYFANVDQIENTSKLYKKITYETRVGQLMGDFEVDENVYLDIYTKYLIDYVHSRSQLLSLDKVEVEGEPGTVLYVKDSFDDDYFKHEIGPTGVLEFYDEDAIITGLKFRGTQLYETETEFEDNVINIIQDKTYSNEKITNVQEGALTIDNDKGVLYLNEEYFVQYDGETILVKKVRNESEVKDNEFRIMPNEISDLKYITNPVKNGVYSINGVKYVNFRSRWNLFNDENIAEGSVLATVNYIYEYMKGEYLNQ
jgi:hypothetical protein